MKFCCLFVLFVVFACNNNYNSVAAAAAEETAPQKTPEQLINSLIAKNTVMIFSKSFCPYCRSTKEIFNALGIEYFALELDQEEFGKEIQDALQKKTGQKTVPNVFIAKQHIGGHSNVVAHQRSGYLKELLNKAGFAVQDEKEIK